MLTLAQKHQALLEDAKRVGQTPPDNLRMCFEVLTLATSIDRACAIRLAPHNLSEGKFVLLFLLRDQPQGLAAHELADKAGVTRATVTGLLDGLQRDGFVVRYSDGQDRRKISVRLTTNGLVLAERLVNEHSQWISSLFAGFYKAESALLSRLLERVSRNLEK